MKNSPDSQRVIIGKFGKTYGIHGWLYVNSFTEPYTSILEYNSWLLQCNDGLWREVHIEGHRLHKGSIVVKLPDINTPEEAKKLTNCQIAIAPEQLPKLPKGEYYWFDLVGLTVVNQVGKELGVIDHLFATGSNDVLVVKRNGEERLLPYISGVVLKVDLDVGQMFVEWDEDEL
ncbi:MAG: ribosome maturation factor RimM [Gammaproteobacteria bacterium]|nr:ribosome maturation factor RimM [Gammaproteobacteria bacterium]